MSEFFNKNGEGEFEDDFFNENSSDDELDNDSVLPFDASFEACVDTEIGEDEENETEFSNIPYEKNVINVGCDSEFTQKSPISLQVRLSGEFYGKKSITFLLL